MRVRVCKEKISSRSVSAIFMEKEVIGTNATAAAKLNRQYEYFLTAANRQKKNNNSASFRAWWTRSPDRNSSTDWLYFTNTGSLNVTSPTNTGIGICCAALI